MDVSQYLYISMRFNELRNVLENYSYKAHHPKDDSSHCTFLKEECNPLRFQNTNQ